MQATPFLMFQGQAAPALELYRRAFPDLELIAFQEHEMAGMDGQIAHARVRLGGQEWILNDSPPVHDFTFTPSTSIFIDCDDEEQLRRLADMLGQDGKTLMALQNYGFSTLFTWVQDRFGVSWQLNLK